MFIRSVKQDDVHTRRISRLSGREREVEDVDGVKYEGELNFNPKHARGSI